MLNRPQFVVISLLFILLTTFIEGQESVWEKVDEGLFIGEFQSPRKSIAGDSKITIIKIDPEYYELSLIHI